MLKVNWIFGDVEGIFQSFQVKVFWEFIFSPISLFRNEHFWHICESEIQWEENQSWKTEYVFDF